MALGRRAQNDPGQFVKRIYADDYDDYERLDRWQARAIDVAVDSWLAARPAPVCDTCGGDGEVLTMVPGSTGEPVEGMVPCPDCVAQRPRNDGIARPAPDTLADRVQRWADSCDTLARQLDAADPESANEKRLLADDLRALLAGRSDASPEGGEQRG